jgi:hypothetical protein
MRLPCRGQHLLAEPAASWLRAGRRLRETRKPTARVARHSGQSWRPATDQLLEAWSCRRRRACKGSAVTTSPRSLSHRLSVPPRAARMPQTGSGSDGKPCSLPEESARLITVARHPCRLRWPEHAEGNTCGGLLRVRFRHEDLAGTGSWRTHRRHGC